VTGTDAVHSDDPMTPEAAAELSQSILGDLGIKTPDQANGADHPGQTPAEANPTPTPAMGAPAGANPEQPPEPGATPTVPSPAPDKSAAWVATLPDVVQADLGRLAPETVAILRQNAEGGMRQDDYTRKTQELARDNAQNAILAQKAEFADSILNDRGMMARLYGEDPAGAPPAGEPIPTIADLMKTQDPEAFAAGLDQIITKRVETTTSAAKAADPDTKAARVNHAADKIHMAVADKLPEGVWDRACGLFTEHCERKGARWFDTPVEQLAMDLRPHLRFALAEHAARGQQQPQATVPGVPDTSKPTPQPGVRAAAIPSSGPNIPSAATPAHVREGREISEDEAYQRTMTKYGIPNEDELARLRNLT